MCVENRAAPFAFVLTTGDNFYLPDGTATRSNYTRPERCLISAHVRWRATWGNHDVGRPSTATVLGARRRWYAFTAGPARFLVLDGNDPLNRRQVAFIRRQLAVATQPVRIVVYHQPLRTAGLHPPADAARAVWEPLFRAGHVTLALQGHNHAYEHIEAGGLTYITTGGGGAPLYPCLRPANGLVKCASIHHFLLMDVSPTEVRVRAVLPSGATLDDLRLPVR